MRERLDGRADLPVVPDGGVEGQQALDDPGPRPGRDAPSFARIALAAALCGGRRSPRPRPHMMPDLRVSVDQRPGVVDRPDRFRLARQRRCLSRNVTMPPRSPRWANSAERRLCAACRRHARCWMRCPVGGAVMLIIVALRSPCGQPDVSVSSPSLREMRDRSGHCSHDGGTPGGAAFLSGGDGRRGMEGANHEDPG